MTMSTMDESYALFPPQLPPFLVNVFNLRPILGNPSREEVKLVHEALRALNNFFHTPELRDTDLSTELSQHLFDIQMTCHRQKYPTSLLPNDVVYEPPTLPPFIPVELKSVTGPPSNEEIASAHAALRMSESFVNVPSIFDPDLHVQLSQHLFDIQLARYVQRSIVKRMTTVPPAPQNQTAPHTAPRDTEANNSLGIEGSPIATLDQSTDYQNPRESDEPRRATDLMIQIRDTLKNVARILVGTQNSLARARKASWDGGLGYDLGAHSLINNYGEVPEMQNLPTFKSEGYRVGFAVNSLSEDTLSRYLRFYNIGQEMIEEGEELKIKWAS
ncbi:hypothetical protein B0J17DRAFT_667988 [Rhizoctonia solani]|nr:hypothetical protein B0J17DRAFT_667988 [Rhizoctonia solani]